MENLGEVLDMCVPVSERRNWWKTSILDNYVPAMGQLRGKPDFSDQDISDFQAKIDAWFHYWVKLHKLAGATNYIHLLVLGHISEYLKFW